MTGCTIALSNGLTFTRTYARDPYRKNLINAVSNSVDGVSVHSTSYAHDLLSRRTNIVMTVQSGTNTLSCAYNARNEVTGVTIDTNDYVYIYDNIGNSLFTSLNTVTNAFTVNNLNQYKAVTNLLDLSGIELSHDEDGNTTLLGEHELAYDDENRLSLYLFAWEPGSTGTIQNAYIHDHLGRRVKKIVQELQVDDPGGMLPPTYWWRTNEVTTFVYDGWNLIHERVAHTNGTVDEIEYVWGLDLSGTLQGAGGVGGLLYEKRNGNIFIPCYDANGNVTSYVDTNGTVRAYRQFDAFGNTIAKGGDMVDVFHFWFSTKYLDHDTGLYYYGYRYYSPILQRWINRDPIEEGDGFNLYNFVSNNSVQEIDPFGLWKKGETINDGRRRIYIKEANDSFESLSKIVGLELGEIHKWARFERLTKNDTSSKCNVSVPNVWISADLLRGGSTYSEFVSLGGSIGQFFGTDLFTYGFKIEKPTTIQQLASALGRNQKDVWGLAVFGHGDKWGRLGATTTPKTRGVDWIPQKRLLPYVDFNGYRLAKIYMMQCFSKYKGSVTIPETDVTMNVDYESMWKKRAVENGFFGYSGVNALGIDWH